MSKSALSTFKLNYRDPLEQKEYYRIKLPLLQDTFMWLFIFIALLLVPLTVRYFNKGLHPQNYIGVTFLVIAVIVVLVRKKLWKFLGFLSAIYVSIILILYIVNMGLVLDKQEPHEAFYMGYAFALIQRMLDSRIGKFYMIAVLNILFAIAKFTVIKIPDPSQAVLVIFLEIFPLILSFKAEKAEKLLFDSLYKSKCQLLNFKQFLTDYLPNPMTILSNDYSYNCFSNVSFKRFFSANDINQIKTSLQELILDKETIAKNRDLLDILGYDDNRKSEILTLSSFLSLLLGKKDLLQPFKEVQLQVYQDLKNTDLNNLSNRSKEAANTINTMNRLITKEERIQVDQVGTSASDRTHIQRSQYEKLRSQHEELLETARFNREEVKRNENEEDQGDSAKNSKSFEAPTRKLWKVTIFPILWENSEAMAVILDDVTHERTIMELKISDRNKDLVIAMVSHELRTPLNIMLGTVDIVKKKLAKLEKAVKEDVFAYLEVFKNNSFLLLNLVNSILDFSQAKNKKLKLNNYEVNIPVLFDKVTELFQNFCKSKNIFLRTIIDDNVPQIIKTDPERLGQVLIILVGNAFKFTYVGGITIRVTLESERPCRVKFLVEDTGVGIKKEDMDKLFKMFGRFDQQERRVNTHGIGLGLTIGNTLAELLTNSDNKGIQVLSEVGKGSIFSFVVQDRSQEQIMEEFPLEDLDENGYHENIDEIKELIGVHEKISTYYSRVIDQKPFRRSSSRIKSSDLTFENLKIQSHNLEGEEHLWCLIVDDNPFNLLVAQNIMEEKKYHVKTAMNGLEAIKVAKEHSKENKKFDLILMDCQMPVMNGYEASRELRKLMNDGEMSQCPIVAVTATIKDEEHEKLSKEVGMSGYIAKPLQIIKLDAMLAELKARDQNYKSMPKL